MVLDHLSSRTSRRRPVGRDEEHDATEEAHHAAILMDGPSPRAGLGGMKTDKSASVNPQVNGQDVSGQEDSPLEDEWDRFADERDEAPASPGRGCGGASEMPATSPDEHTGEDATAQEIALPPDDRVYTGEAENTIVAGALATFFDTGVASVLMHVPAELCAESTQEMLTVVMEIAADHGGVVQGDPRERADFILSLLPAEFKNTWRRFVAIAPTIERQIARIGNEDGTFRERRLFPVTTYRSWAEVPDAAPVAYRIKRLVPIGGITFIAAEYGSLKTMTAQEMTRAIVTGTKFLDIFDVEPGPVLWIQNDAGIGTFRQRWKLLEAGRPLGDAKHDVHDTFEKLTLNNRENFQWFIDTVEHYAVPVVFIDVLRNVHTVNSKLEEMMKPLILPLMNYGREHHVAFVVMHHAMFPTKEKEGLPPSALAYDTKSLQGYRDSFISLQRQIADHRLVKVTVELKDDDWPKPFCIRLKVEKEEGTDKTRSLRLEREEIPSKEEKAEATVTKVKEVFHGHPGEFLSRTRWRELFREAGGKASDPTLRKIVDGLLSEGFLVPDGDRARARVGYFPEPEPGDPAEEAAEVEQLGF